jgi:hypothetical protein
MNRRPFISCALLVLCTACIKRTPVEEFSPLLSGVVVHDAEITLTPNDWAVWRGPHGNGIAVDQPLATSWSDSENVRWRTNVPGRGHSSPIVVGDQVVVATAIEQQQQQMVVAYDRADGSERWRTVVHTGGFPSKSELHNKSTNANSTLASDGKYLFVALLNQSKVIVTALDLNGRHVWQREAGAFAPKFGYAPSPILYRSLVIIAADNQGGGYLAALDRETGDLAWRTARGNASSYSSPTIGTLGGTDQLLITGGDRLASYNPADGKLNWETPCIAESTCGTVVVADDCLLASGGYPDNETVCVSSMGVKLWSNNVKGYEPSLIAFGGFAFLITDDGIAHCWQISDGKLMWRERLGGNFSSSPVVCNGNIYVASLNGKCYVFRASGDGYEEVAENRLGSNYYASPAISGGEIFFRIGIGSDPERREEIVCIGNPSGTTSKVASNEK